MSSDLSSLDFKKKGWSKGKLLEVADQFKIDIPAGITTFYQVRSVLITAQKGSHLASTLTHPIRGCEEAQVRAINSPISTLSDLPDPSVQDGHITENIVFEDPQGTSLPSLASNTLDISSTPLLPIVEVPAPAPAPDPVSVGCSTMATNKALHGPATSSLSSKEFRVPTRSRSIQVKTSVFEECKVMCDNIGIPDSERVALNFLCERSLAPDFLGKHDDDMTKATSATSRAMGVVSGEPYFPHDNDVMNRDLKISFCGDHIVCEHDDFPEDDMTSDDMTLKAIPKHFPSSESPLTTATIDYEIRVLWLKFPLFQSRFAPYRHEQIEFAVDSNNTSKMMLDVDRTIRSLICVHNTYGLSKRHDKMNAYYLLNSTGDIIVLNSGLLKRCPLKNNVGLYEDGKPLWLEPLYLCLYDAVPGENPKPAQLRNREWRYAFPFPEICKSIFLMGLLLLVYRGQLYVEPTVERTNNSVSEEEGGWFEYAEDLFSKVFFLTNVSFEHIISTINNRGVNTVMTSVHILRHNSISVQVVFILNALCQVVLFPVLSYIFSDFNTVDFTVPLFYLMVCYGMVLVMRLRAKFCIFNLSWLWINRYWYFATDLSLRRLWGGRRRRPQVFENYPQISNGKQQEHALMRVRYEEDHVTRFLVLRWIPTLHFEEDYELWASTLRAALGVSTSSQNDPDMLVSDPKRSGVRIALSPAFLKYEMYKKRDVFKICKPGRISRGYDKYFYMRFMFLACVCWAWVDVVLPLLRYSSSGADIDNGNNSPTFPSYAYSCSYSSVSIPMLVVECAWRNTLSSLMVDLSGIDKDHWPAWAGYDYSVPSLLAFCVGILLW